MVNNRHDLYKDNSRMVRKTRQVVMLYEGAIRYVQQAKKAIEENDIETRYNSLVKACDIVTGLQLCLDFEKGGQVSKTLYNYYAGLDMRLLSIHQSNSIEMCDLCIKHLRMMKDAWEEIDQKHGKEDSGHTDIDLSSAAYAQPIANAATSIAGLSLSMSA